MGPSFAVAESTTRTWLAALLAGLLTVGIVFAASPPPRPVHARPVVDQCRQFKPIKRRLHGHVVYARSVHVELR
jgi:hypothetical protein